MRANQIILCLFFSALSFTVRGQVIFSDNFDYTSGTNLTAAGAGWTAFSSAGVNPVTVASSGLVYTGYPNSGVGQAINLQNVSGEDVEHASATTMMGSESIYAGFLLQVSSANSSAGDLVLNFAGNGASCVQSSGFAIRESSGLLRFGLSNNGATSYSTNGYNYNEVYLIVVEYNSGSKQYLLYVNPVLESSKPSPTHSILHSCSSHTSITSTRIYQNGVAAAAIDGLIVSKDWSDIVGGTGSGESSNLVINENFDYPTGVLSGTGGWTTEFGNGTNPVTLVEGSLSFNTYGSSGIGTMMQISSIVGDGVRIGSSTGIPGSFYLGFLISVASATNNSVEAAITLDGNGNSEFRNSGFTLRNSGGSLIFGLQDESGPVQFAAGNFVFGQVYFVVMEFNNSFSTGRFRLYINPPMNAPRPSHDINMDLGSGMSDADALSAVKFHQNGHGSYFIDGIRAGTNWADIVAVETPAHQATALNANGASANAMNVTFTGAADIPTGYLVLRKSGSSPTGSPVDNTIYNAGDALGDGVIVSSGPSVSFTDISGLSAETNYHYAVFSMNSANGQIKYRKTSPLSGSGFTFSSEPSNGPASFISSSPDDSEIDLTFSSPSPVSNTDGYLLIRSPNAVSSLSFVLDGISPASFSLPEGITLVADVTNSAQTSYTDTGLAPNTSYTHVIVPYNFDGTNAQTYNYFTSSITSVPGLTRPAAPVANAASSPTESGFDIGWSATVGTADYRLDVATANTFGASIIGAYNNLTLNATSYTVSGLSPDTEYFYQVRAVNSAGTSVNSNYISQRTVTLAPVASEETGVTPIGFTANWAATAGATGYKLDIATDAGFENLIYDDVTVSGTNAAVSDLNSGTSYYYQVRALNNGGASANSNTITAITIPAPPVAAEATFITTSSFIANWAASAGAAEYRLDVFVETEGNFLSPYNDFTVSGTSQLINGLAEGVTYLYKVRAVNEAGASLDSDIKSVLTVPPVPTSLPATSISASGFTAHWSAVSGATGYVLYVADNASNFIGNYDGTTSLAATAEVIDGLQTNTLYHYYVKATSSSGTSEASGTIDVLTLPPPPTNPTSSAISQTTFIASWIAAPGITECLLEVSADNFTSNLTGYDNLLVAGLSQEVTGLTPGTSYSFKVRSKNTTGPSDDSETGTVLLIPANPIAIPAASISKNAFTAQWNAVTGVENYILDVSDNAGFTSFLTGYSGKLLPADQITEQIGSLLPGTAYYYQVRAANSSGESDYSNTVSQVTIPDKPVLSIPTQITSTSFLASWEEEPGATSYELDAFSSTDNFVTIMYVPGYESKPISGGTEDPVSGLTPSTHYRFRVRAKNSAGVSENSAYKSVLTLQPDGTGVNLPTVSVASPTAPNTVKAQISGGLPPWTVILYHKKITESSMVEEPAQVTSTNTIDFPVGGFLDELGMEYYFKVTDEGGRESLSAPSKYTISFEANTKTFLAGSFAGNRSSMMMLSIPYVLNNNAVETLFGSLGVYDKRVWRLAHYSNGRNIEYQTPGFPSIDRGMGLWFNARVANINLKTSSGNVGPNDQATPFVLELDAGWNQIGNPYPFPIDWSDVLADNPANTGVDSELMIYDGAHQNFDAADDLNVYEGAFVFSDDAANLDVKVTLRNTFASGRRKQTEINRDLGGTDWQVPLTIKQGQSTLRLGGFGMHPHADASRDKFDAMRLPRFDEYLDVTFEHPEFRFPHFSKDIVPTSEEHVWSFAVESSNILEDGLIQWDNSQFGNNDAQLFLLDVKTAQLINMREQSSFIYSVAEKRSFKVYFTLGNKEFSPGILLLGSPYPNPSRDQVDINLILPDVQRDYGVELIVYDHTGKPVKHIVNSRLRGGVHQLQWDAADYSGDPVSSGFYFLRAKVNGQYKGDAQRLLITK